jgi:hypothetical protein
VFALDNKPEPEELKTELLEKSIATKNIFLMKNTKYPTYVVITDKNTTLPGLQTKVRGLLKIIVRWEKLKNKTPIIQCHRCQKWDHTATNCNSKIKCMKCGNEHTTKECDIKKRTPRCMEESNVQTAAAITFQTAQMVPYTQSD